MTKLKISPDLQLPLEAVTETFSILAKRGAGKTYAALVMVEEMLKAGLQVVTVDPIGVHWGLRSSADGSAAGYPIVVVGGEHGDIPLEEAAGELLADLVVAEGLSLVLDLSLLRKGAARRFMTDFAETLYRKNREPLHLVLDEADEWAPQRPPKGAERLLGAVEDLVRRGRARGIGVTLVTQRSAVLAKDVLTQTEVLVAMRTTGPQDRAAIEAWVKVHGDEEGWRTMLASLHELPIGTAWFWSPGWLGGLQRVRIRERETYDSSATPRAGVRPKAPKKLADVDLDAISAQMKAMIEKAEASDPAKLQRRIRELEGQIRKLEARPAGERVVEVEKEVEVRVEVPVLPPEVLPALKDLHGRLMAASGQLLEEAEDIDRLSDRLAHAAPERSAQAGRTPSRAPSTRPQAPSTRAEAASTGREAVRKPTRVARPPAAIPDGDFAPTSSQQKVLDALAWFEQLGIEAPSREALAFIADTRPTSGGFKNNLGALRTAGLLDYPQGGLVSLTDAGRALATATDIPATNDGLQEAVKARLTGSQGRIVDAVCEAYPVPLSREELAAAVDVPPTSGGFKNNLGALRTLGLLDYPAPGLVVALPVLYPEG